MRIAIFYILFVSCTAYALWRGGAPERAVAGSYFSIWLLDQALHFVYASDFTELDPGHLVIDLLIWVAFFTVAMRAKRFWPLWLASLQTIAVVAHSAKFLDVTIAPRAYLTMQIASSFPVLILLAFGTYNHQKRLKENGFDPSWRSKSLK
ncbi:MAG: hypothetical protein ABJO01_13990 [Parasphingorhabdus sp.]|uniref:hypothetical protein n=1 Tax=Parasphingorhabdus sp. TaxID=2709688 RepID=UPI0032969115